MRVTSKRACTCGRIYDLETWTALPLTRRLTAEHIASLASPWPPHLVVEVRVCAGCHRPLARLWSDAHRSMAESRRAIAA